MISKTIQGGGNIFPSGLPFQTSPHPTSTRGKRDAMKAMNKRPALFPLYFAATIFLLTLSVVAQPGDERRVYEEAAASIKAFDEKIAQRPNDPALYFQRGSVYLGLFNRHADVAEYRGVIYVNDPGGKALNDLNRAIELDRSKSEYYAARGQFNQVKWAHDSNRESDAALPWEKWKLLNWDNRSFDLSAADYEKALSLARSVSDRAGALGSLLWLYRSRASALSFYLAAKIVRAEKQTRHVFDDFDRSLAYARAYLDTAGRPSYELFLLRDIYRDKARAAIEFEEYPVAIKILSDATNEIEARRPGSEDVCSLYILRGDINQKLKEYDSAIRDYTFPIDHKYLNCDAIHEKRGDAYSAKRDWQRAIDDYSRELSSYTYLNVSLLTRRARAFIEIGEPEKAVTDLDKALTFDTMCPAQYELRAEAYRMLKEDIRARADETAAAKFSRNKLGCSP